MFSKKKQLKMCTLAFGCMLGVLFACTKELGDESNLGKIFKRKNEQLTVSVAQRWFENNYEKVVTTRSSGGKERPIKPCWEKAKEHNRNRYEVVETPILSRGGRLAVDRETAEKWQPGQKTGFIRNTTKMVVLMDKQTREARSFIMTFIGSYNYLKNTRSMGRNNYLYREPDFDGYVMFYEVDGAFINGWKYADGRIIGIVSASTEENAKMSTRLATRSQEQECTTEWITNFYEECITGTWSVETEYGIEYHSEEDCRLISETEYFEVCRLVEDGNGNSSGGVSPGGGDNNGNSSGNNGTIVPSQELLNSIYKDIKSIFILHGKFNFPNVAIKYKGNDMSCFANAKVVGGVIVVCDRFFDYSLKDQASIIWHEMSHIDNRETKIHDLISVDSYRLQPPPDILAKLREFSEAQCIRENLSIDVTSSYVNNELEIAVIASEEYHKNEVRCYTEEKKNGIEVSDAYSAERDFLLWRHQEILNKHYK